MTPVQHHLDLLAAAPAADEDGTGLGIAMTLVDGHGYRAGSDAEVSLGALAAPLVYAMAVEDHGVEKVLERIGTEPAADPLHRIEVEPETYRAYNGLTDTGVVAAAALVKGRGGRDRAGRFLQLASTLLGREVTVTDTAARVEDKANRRTRAAAWFMKSIEAIDADPTVILGDVSRLRAVQVDVQELSVIAAVFAHGGVHPLSGERVFSPETVQAVVSLMSSCGLVTRDPLWALTVGQPGWASRRGGTIMVVVPGHMGLALQAHGLDEHGLSAEGVKALRRLVEAFEIHPSVVAGSPRSALRSHYRVDQAPSGTARTAEVMQAFERHGDCVHLMELGGHVGFSQVEALVHVVSAMPEQLQTLAVDVRSVSSVSPAARRLVAQWAAHTLREGLDIVITDRDETLLDQVRATAAEEGIELPEPLRESEAFLPDVPSDCAQFVFFTSRSQAMQWCEQRLLARHEPQLLPKTEEEAAVSPLLQHLSPDDARLVESMMDTRRFADGQIIRRAGQPFGGIYVITSGQVELTGQATGGRRMRRMLLTPGMIFGEMALGQPGRQPGTVRARGAVTTRVLTAQVMYALEEAAPQLAMKLWEALARDAFTALQQLIRETGALQD